MNTIDTMIKSSWFKSSMMLLCMMFFISSMAARNAEAQVPYTGVPESDSLALVAFYEQMNGDAWVVKGGWLVDPVNTWEGINVVNAGTDVEPDWRVRRIEMPFPNMGLPGELPIELGNLEYLDRLTIREDLLTGEVPIELGDLPRLARFRTSRNFMTGEFPFEALANAPEGRDNSPMDRLENEENYYYGVIPDVLAGFENLSRFDLRFNRFTGELPPSIADMTNMGRLRLGHNNIGGDLPDLSHLSNLDRIEIDNMPLEPGPVWPWLENLGDQIRHLFIMNTNRTGTIPEWVGNSMLGMTDAGFGEDMPVPGGGLGGTIPSNFQFLDALNIVVFQGMHWEGSIPGFLGEMTNLNRIYFRHCSFSGDIPGQLANLTNRLEIRNCPYLTGGLPEEFEVSPISHIVIDNSPSNNSIYIYWPYDSEFNEANPGVVGMSSMEVGPIPAYLGNLDLGELILSNVGLTGTIPESLGNITGLSSLNFSYNPGLTGSLPEWLETSMISHLDVSYTGMDVPEIPEWLNSPDIRAGIWHIGLAGLGMGGEIPWWIGNLNLLTNLSLADNNLEGSIPPSIGDLRRLDSLNLANNMLSGTLPSQFYDMGRLGGDFYGIESIDLSGNEGLTGELAMSLANATEMRVFHYDGTNLTAPNDAAFQEWLDVTIPANTHLRFPPIYTSVRKNIPLAQPAIVVLGSPEDGAIDVGITPQLTWGASDLAETYHLQLSMESDFSELVLDVETIVSTEYQISEELELGVTYYWRIRAGNDSGYSDWSATRSFTTVTSTSIDQEALPVTYELRQNYPNPFNPSTKIRYAVPELAHVRLDVYNALGQRIATLVNEERVAGWYEVNFDASIFASGTYIYRMQAGHRVLTQSMTLIK